MSSPHRWCGGVIFFLQRVILQICYNGHIIPKYKTSRKLIWGSRQVLWKSSRIHVCYGIWITVIYVCFILTVCCVYVPCFHERLIMLSDSMCLVTPKCIRSISWYQRGGSWGGQGPYWNRVGHLLAAYRCQRPLLLTWFNLNPSMD